MSSNRKAQGASPEIAVEVLPHGLGLDLPSYATLGSAGMDLAAAIDGDIVLTPGARCLVPTGLILALPDSWEGQIRPRSGLALKHGITVLNTPGTLDSDYRGEVKVILINLGEQDFTLTRGMRAAQLVIAPVARAMLVESGAGQTARGAGGFGSTGISPAQGKNRAGAQGKNSADARSKNRAGVPC